MKIQIEFFKDDLIAAIGAGIYEVSVSKNGRTRPLYIGESVYTIVRCASHLYRLKNKPEYFGFTKETIDDSEIILSFKFVVSIHDMQNRRAQEKELIKQCKPINQSGISDRQKGLEERIAALDDFLKECEKNDCWS